MVQMNKTLETIREIVKSVPIAAPTSVSEKGRADFVTNVDKAVDEYLRTELESCFPDYGFLTEESVPDIDKRFIWIIDPIDGTTNFLNGLPYAVSVALCDRKSHEALLGVVYDPETETEYFASKGKSAYSCRNGNCVKLPDRHPQSFENSVAILATSYDRSVIPSIFDKATKLIMKCADIRAIGPAAFDICRVAERKASVYFARTLKPWDYAAGYLILKEAGGQFLEKNGWQLFFQDEDTLTRVGDMF